MSSSRKGVRSSSSNNNNNNNNNSRSSSRHSNSQSHSHSHNNNNNSDSSNSSHSTSATSSSILLDNYDSARRFYRDEKYMERVQKYGHSKKVLCLEWNSNGEYLASGCAANTINIYRTHSQRTLRESNVSYRLSQSQKGPITGLSWHPQNSSVLCAASEDATVHLWNVSKFSSSANSNSNSSSSSSSKSSSASASTAANSNLKPFHIIKTGNALTGIEWSHKTGAQIAITDRENTLTLVDGHKYTEMNKKKLEHRIHAFKWSNDNRFLLVVTKEGYLEIYDARDLAFVHSFIVHNGNCFCLDVNANMIVTGGADSILSIIDSRTLTQLFGLPLFETPVNHVQIHPSNEQIIASCSNDNFIDISWAQNGKQLSKIQTQSGVSCLAWHPTKHLLAYALNMTSNVQQDSNAFPHYANNHNNQQRRRQLQQNRIANENNNNMQLQHKNIHVWGKIA